ncbi:thioredoxin domain-containing protein [Zhongshania arctica]|uniref:Thioredoxin domain-containing protein n=1 Tax=Zhongshania arctica TaxID=3238302 RepID=A0ABV3TXG1_9GAMM
MIQQASLLFILLSSLIFPAAAAENSAITWRQWSPQVFSEAKASGKHIILNVEAVWCHWCHVMDQKTYSDPQVGAAVDKDFIAIKVDHDAHPEIAARYRAWGWPATIFYNSDGVEIVKRAGYIPPDSMTALLNAIVRDPSPENTGSLIAVTTQRSALIPADKANLIAMHKRSYDAEYGSLAIAMKFIDPDSVEYALLEGMNGDESELARANKTLTAALKLEDPEWSGFYQYSTHGDWDHPHFEKIMRSQTRSIRLYAQAYAATKNPAYQAAAERTVGYLNRFLKAPDGGFYTSQDADLIQGQKSAQYFALKDQQRIALGIPRVDTHRYTKENATLISALTRLYSATGDTKIKAQAISIGEWLLANRQRSAGGFNHGSSDSKSRDDAKLFLADNISALAAFIDLYEISADRQWLRYATASADVIREKIASPDVVGLPAASIGAQDPLAPYVDLEENIQATRAINTLFHYSGREIDKVLAEKSMAYISSSEVIASRFTEAGILLADAELNRDPLHLVVVGSKSDVKAQKLFSAALATSYQSYRRIEWWDRSEGALINHDVEYPSLAKAAAFVCNDKRCSTPIYKANEIQEVIALIEGTQK